MGVNRSMSFRVPILHKYIVRQMLGTMIAVLVVVMSLMMLEHLPNLLEVTRLSGHRGYIIGHTVASLLPEYGGIGLLVGLFLGIALTIRKLALRGELDVIEACGIAPLHWMRFPFTLAVLVSIVTIINQGWLMPAGEIKLAEIGRRMEAGEFGHQLQAGEFITLGPGNVLLFDQVDGDNSEVLELFLQTEGNTFTARRGRIWRLPYGATAFDLRDGQILQKQAAGVLNFSQFEYHVDDVGAAPGKKPKKGPLNRTDIESLWAIGTPSSRSAVYGRFLWAVLALLLPLLALILSKPPRRQSGAVGILFGVIALVLGLKMITPLTDGDSTQPELLAAGILTSWAFFVSGLIWAEKVFGNGFIDFWTNQIIHKFRRPGA